MRLENVLQVATPDPAFHLPSRKSVSNQVQQRYDAAKQAEVDVLGFLSMAEEKPSRQKVTAAGWESARATMAAARRLPPSLNHHRRFADGGFGEALAKGRKRVSHFKHSPANKEELHQEPPKTAADAGCFHKVEFNAGYDLLSYSRGFFLLQTNHFTSISAGNTPNAGDCPLTIKVNKTNFWIDLLLVSLKHQFVSFSIVLDWNVIKCTFFPDIKSVTLQYLCLCLLFDSLPAKSM